MEKENYYIKEDATVLEAMQAINENGLKSLFVVDNNKLKGSITDGDARRWIVNGGDVNASVTKIVNYSPKHLTVSSKINPNEFMRKNRIEAVPIVNDKMEIQRIISWTDHDQSIQRERVGLPVVIMAGGKGTRLYPYTKILPKPLIPVGEIPIVQRIMDEFKQYQCDNFFMIVNHKRSMIKAYFNELQDNYNVNYVDEDIPLGTGGGISLLKGKVNETFILTNCDIMVTADIASIYKWHKKRGNIITMVCCNKIVEVPYGVIEINKNNEIKSMVEKPQLPFLTNTGVYFVEPRVIEELEENLAIGFPDIIEKYKAAGEKIGVYTIEEDEWLDMGQPEELERMRQYIER